MGLDMYLDRRIDLKSSIADATKIKEVAKIMKNARIFARSEACYWRKFNALHKYITDKFLDDGEDDNCKDIIIGIDDIKELLALLKGLRKKIKIGDGYVCMSTQWLSKDDIGEHEVGDIIDASELNPKLLDEHGDVARVIVRYKRDGELPYEVEFQRKGETIVNPEVCEEEFPTEAGFFFGSTAYDKWYVDDIDDTIEKLEKVVDEHEELVKAGVEETAIDYIYRAWY